MLVEASASKSHFLDSKDSRQMHKRRFQQQREGKHLNWPFSEVNYVGGFCLNSGRSAVNTRCITSQQRSVKALTAFVVKLTRYWKVKTVKNTRMTLQLQNQKKKRWDCILGYKEDTVCKKLKNPHLHRYWWLRSSVCKSRVWEIRAVVKVLVQQTG